jgi:hypothetical protein
LLAAGRDLASQLQSCAAAVDATLQSTERLGERSAELVQRGFDALAQELRDRVHQGDLQTLRTEIDRRFTELLEHIRSVQINQLELSRPGPLRLRVAGSTQPSLPLSRSASGELGFVEERGDKPYRIAVISLPKSGTYLLAEVLFELGYVNTHVQAWAYGLHDFRDKTLEQMVHDYLDFHVALPIEATAPLVRTGQFWVGHFEIEKCRTSLADFRKLFTIRDLRFALVSYMRWLSRPGRGGAAADAWRHLPDTEEKFVAFFETHGRTYLSWCRDIIDWRLADEVCTVRFEDITGMSGERATAEAVAAIATALGEGEVPVATALHRSLGRQTKTYSGGYSRLENVWSERVQGLFAEAGGVELNGLLGYPRECSLRADRV